MLPQYEPRQKPQTEEGPTGAELQATIELQRFIDKYDAPATEEQKTKRQEVLSKIKILINEFVRIIAKKTGNTAEGLENVESQLVPYGSYRLGVVSEGSDIDCIVVAPSFVKRSDFFNTFYEMMFNHPSVKELVKVENAYSPIMSFHYDGIEIDLSFASLAMTTVAEDTDFADDHILDNVDEESVRSLNGRRVNDMLLQLVPNQDIFRVVLRFLRIWAKKRCVYGNVFGYLGGVNLAILAAFICQRYPKKSPAYIIVMFFNDLATWNWPEPIYINTPTTGNRSNWDPTRQQDHKDCMPIITPAYPTINSLHSATKSSRNRMNIEFKRGFKVASACLKSEASWERIIDPPKFFVRHRKFVEVLVVATEEKVYTEFMKFVQSRVRFLAINIETQLRHVSHAYIWPVEFPANGYRGNEFCSVFYIGLSYHVPKDENQSRTLDLTSPAKKWVDDIRQKAPPNADVILEVVDTKDLPSFLFPNGERPEIKNVKKVEQPAK